MAILQNKNAAKSGIPPRLIEVGASCPAALVKKLAPEAILPHRGSEYAAGYDLYALNGEEFTIKAGETMMVKTGLAMEIPENYYGGIYARSGLASKKGLRPANCVGVIDADYRGEVCVALHNDTGVDQTLAAHERVAQLVIQPFLPVVFEETEELSDTVRGAGGFGSTGNL